MGEEAQEGERKTRRRENPLADLFFPRFCVCSGLPVPADAPYRYLHPQEASRLITVRAPHCRTCGHPFWGEAVEEAVCPHCLDLRAVFGEGRTAALMRDPARRLLVELKYHGGFYLIPDLVAMALHAPGYMDFLEDAVLVPVPLHARRLRQRGFNQSLLLARALAREARNCSVLCLLERLHYTTSQTRLRREERRKNMEGAFALRRGVNPDKEQRLVLFDDVFTTGATLNACARVLKKAGAGTVDVATLCHG